MEYSFYQISSKKNQQVEGGLTKRSLGCESSPDLFLFFWLDQDGVVQHMQFLFFERLFDWRNKVGFTLYRTNRLDQANQKVGYQKGARSLEEEENPEAEAQAREILETAQIPEPFGRMVKEILKR